MILGTARTEIEVWPRSEEARGNPAIRILLDDASESHFLYIEHDRRDRGSSAPRLAETAVAALKADRHGFEMSVNLSPQPLDLGPGHELASIAGRVVDWTGSAAIGLLAAHLLELHGNAHPCRAQLSEDRAEHIARWMVAARFAPEHAQTGRVRPEERLSIRKSMAIDEITFGVSAEDRSIVGRAFLRVGSDRFCVGYWRLPIDDDQTAFLTTFQYNDLGWFGNIGRPGTLVDLSTHELAEGSVAGLATGLLDAYLDEVLIPRVERDRSVQIDEFESGLRLTAAEQVEHGWRFEYLTATRQYWASVEAVEGGSEAVSGAMGWRDIMP